MASTRPRNYPGNYQAEQISINEQAMYNINDARGAPPLNCYAGNGLLPSKMPSMNLSNNACDIESQLFGIGATNLVNPKPEILLNAKPIPSLSIAKRMPLIVPEKMLPQEGRRYAYLR